MKKRTGIIKTVLPFVLSAVFSMPSAAHGLRVAFVGDPQADNVKELEYARKSIYGELIGRKDLDIVIFLGDLVNDNPSLLKPTRMILDSLPCLWFNAPGNHDRDRYRKADDGTVRARDLVSYRKEIGAADTTFVKGGIRFILMNNVRHGRDDYEGGFTEMQKHYLDSVVAASASDRRVVLATHIPFSKSNGCDSLLAVLARCPELLLVSGHLHNVARHCLELPDGRLVEEIIAGAACGSWWRGVKDKDGVPYALQNCGAPRGYFIADFASDGSYRLKYKCVGRNDADMASAHWKASQDLLRGSAKENAETSCGKQPEGTLTVNVFGGSTDGTVEVKGLDGRRWTKLERVNEIAPEVAEIISINHSKTKEERRSRPEEFIPLRRLGSPHVWAVPANRPAGKIKIRYRDNAMSFSLKTAVCTQSATGRPFRRL